MDLRVCEYCGTEFSADLTECPLCGKSVDPAAEDLDYTTVPEETDFLPNGEESRPSAKKPGQRLAKKKRGGKFASGSKKEKPAAAPQPAAPADGNVYKIPKWMMVLICVFLGLAVVIGAAFGIYNMGWFGKRTSSLSAAAASSSSASSSSSSSALAGSQSTTSAQYTNEEDYKGSQSSQSSQTSVVTCSGITLGKTTVTFEETDQFDNLTYTLEPSDCTQAVVFTSSDDKIATVNAQGKVVAVSGGSATITATCGTKTATCLVTCDFKSEETGAETTTPAALSTTDMTLFYPGEKAALTVTNIPAGASAVFSSADTSIASVTTGGTVSAVGSGQTTVTVKVGDQTLTCIVRCKLDDSTEKTGEDANCTISHSDVTMSVAGEYFKISLKDSSGSAVSGVSWSSSDSSVCTVDSSGVVYAAGSGTAYVSTTYGGKTYQCIVRCNLG